MSREFAIKQIILDYCQSHNITPTEFARNSGISKSYISKIILNQFGRLGISMTYLELIAKGMGIEFIEFQKLIEDYQKKAKTENNDELRKKIIISTITTKLNDFCEKDLEIIHSIITDIDSEKLNILHNIRENMK